MDGLVIFYANDSLYNEMLKKGEILKWNPYIFSGDPMYANGHSSFHNPFRLLFNFLFPPVFAETSEKVGLFFESFFGGVFDFCYFLIVKREIRKFKRIVKGDKRRPFSCPG